MDANETTSIEIRFGPNLTQFAHRFSVPANGGTAGDGGAGIAFADYMYQDYVEVPFQVWDTDNNRQYIFSAMCIPWAHCIERNQVPCTTVRLISE